MTRDQLPAAICIDGVRPETKHGGDRKSDQAADSATRSEDFSFANNRADARWLARYRQIAANLRDNDIFRDFVGRLILILHNTPICRRDAEIAALEGLAMGIVKRRAEDNGQPLQEWQQAEIAAAMAAEATLRVTQTPVTAGHA